MTCMHERAIIVDWPPFTAYMLNLLTASNKPITPYHEQDNVMAQRLDSPDVKVRAICRMLKC
jgi:hypothetical protein